jgi:anti-anti-sigma factor
LGGLFGGMPAGGGTTQTAVNRSAGARTQFAELVTAGAALATLLLLAPLIALMPNAVLAAVVVVYSIGLIKPEEFRAIARIRRTEFYWAVVAFLGVMLLGTLRGIVVAVIVSLLALAQQSNNPPVHVLGRKRGTKVFRASSAENPDDETWPGLLLLRPEGRIFFANAERLGDKIRALIQQSKPKVVVLDCRAVIDIEYTALMMLEAAEEKMRREGVVLWLTALNPSVLDVVERSGLAATLGRERMFFKLQTAVETYERSLSAQGSPSAA